MVLDSRLRARGPLLRRVAVRVLLVLGGLVTMLGVLLVVAAWNEDRAIERDMGVANAEVLEVTTFRTLIRFQTADGAEQIPHTGVLYPQDLEVGDVVVVEYERQNPDLVRVAGRAAFVTLLPVGAVVVVTWAVVAPLVWWIRLAERRARSDAPRDAADEM